MIEAVIFDMDGLLIDSEPLWHEAEKATFALVGFNLTLEQCWETTGLKSNKIVEHWFMKKPWKDPSQKDIEKKLVGNLIALVKEKGKAKEGARFILDFMKKKKLKIALASSSVMEIINATVDKLNIRGYFDELYSAEYEEYGKPHPGVYLTTAKMLDIAPENCLAFEDSLNGILAAKSARIKCVAVPDESVEGSPKLSIADLIIPKLSDFSEDMWEELNK
jgi:mannitol-1-/sugar-/sorbitol-6-/2-deoxyglucose-6-phosphatase